MWQQYFIQKSSLWSMWCMQILWHTYKLSLKDKSKTLWYPHSVINWTEENKIEQNNNIPWKRQIDPDRWIRVMRWCIFLSKKENLLKVGKLLVVESKTCDEMPNNGWNISDMEKEGRKLLRVKQIFKTFRDKISYHMSRSPNFSSTGWCTSNECLPVTEFFK